MHWYVLKLDVYSTYDVVLCKLSEAGNIIISVIEHNLNCIEGFSIPLYASSFEKNPVVMYSLKRIGEAGVCLLSTTVKAIRTSVICTAQRMKQLRRPFSLVTQVTQAGIRMMKMPQKIRMTTGMSPSRAETATR